MLLPYYMTLFVPKPFMFFSVLCNYITLVTGVILLSHIVTCITIMCDITSHLLFKSKIKNQKVKSKIKIKENRKEK